MAIAAAETAYQKRQYISEGGVGTSLLFLWMSMVLFLWGFAFIPAPERSPEWMLQTQAVCFGTLSNGLPAAHGWMLLILSPLAILSVMWVSHAKEMSAVPNYIRSSAPSKYFVILLLVMTAWEAHWVGKRVTYAYRLSRLGYPVGVANPLPADYLRLNQLIPEFNLVNQDGKAITQEVFRGHVTIFTFAFAHCTSVCPMLIRDVRTAQSRIDSRDLQTVVMAIDPWRDTPSSLPALAKTWGLPLGSHILSGEPKEVLSTLDALKVTTSRNMQTGDVVHAAQVMLVDRSGKIVYSFLNPSVDWIVTASGRLLNE